MIDDVYEPLARYRDEFREKFSRLAREKFQALTEASGIDVAANRRLVAEIQQVARQARVQRCRKLCFGWLMALGFLGGIAAIAAAFLVCADTPETMGSWVAGGVAGLAFGIVMVPFFRQAARRLARLEEVVGQKTKVAWEQLEPLNRLYAWDLTVGLIEATVPRLAFDPYFTRGRLELLRAQFGWSDGFNDGKSVLFAQSGAINGNPFVFGQYREMEWGEKTYVGTKQISWTEWETGEDGKRRAVRRCETLSASVTKPIPVYSEHKVLVYGNEAAPALSFSREPSGLDGNGANLFGKLKKRWRLNRLRAYSRDLTDDSDFTLMGNHEFETWFHAKDRDNEVEFRLLFTPVAQAQMLQLMKDREVGYGDDFSFAKSKKINVLRSRHLDRAVIDTDPARFRHWDYDAALSNFIRFNERYFKDAYFALAPLLAIPLYQQTRTREELWQGVLARREASFWEHEAIANYYGEERFRHPNSITSNLLKTQVARCANGESVIRVTARGYRGEERVEYKEAFGGDGRCHRVAVRWTEYLPVERTSEMCLTEKPTPSDDFRRSAEAAALSVARRSILSYLRR